DMTGRQHVDLVNLAAVLVLSLCLGAWLIPRSGAIGAGWAISVSILIWSAAEMVEGWIFYRFPPINRVSIYSAGSAIVAFGVGFFLQTRLSVTTTAVIVAALYAVLSCAFALTAADRDIMCRAVWRASRVLQRPLAAPAQD